MRKKLLFVIQKMDVGGSERFLYLLLNNFNKDKFNIHLITVTDTGFFYDKLDPAIQKQCLYVSRQRYSLIKLYVGIRKINPDIVFSMNVNHLNLYIGFLIPFLPSRMRFFTRESTVLSELTKGNSLFGELVSFFYRRTYNNFERVIAQSEYMKSDLVENFNVRAEKVMVINNPVDIDQIQNLANAPVDFNKNDFNMVAVGRLVHVKGFDLLIKAMRHVQIPNYKLYIVGGATKEDPQCTERLIGMIRAFGLENRVILVGFTDNPYKYLANADVVVSTSRYEGFPNVVLEAHSLGKPVVAFNCPGGISEIIVNGLNGVLVEEMSTERFSEIINSFSIRNFDAELIKQSAKKFALTSILPRYHAAMN